MAYVLLQCVKRGSKLRVQMISSHPFIKGINCQFPRAIRQQGMYYVVKQEGIVLRGNFYSAMKSNIIVCQTFDLNEAKRYVDELKEKNVNIVPAKIFGDDGDEECVVCMYDKKTQVFAPCGHYIVCTDCANTCVKCPLCATKIINILARNQIKD
jgi:hypothetical protein